MSDVDEPDEGGEAVCYAHLICPECGEPLGEHDPTSCRAGSAGPSE